MVKRHGLSEELAAKIAKRIKELQKVPETELPVEQQKREFAERERKAQIWLQEDIIAVTKWIQKNFDTIAVTNF